jgi:hypothetical protein
VNTHLNDGTLRLVEQQISLLDTAGTPVSTAYILKTGSLKREVKSADSEDEFGAHRGSMFALGKRAGSITLQFIGASDLLPQPLQYFSVKDSTGATVKCILLAVGDKFGAFEEAMVDCECQVCASQSAITATLPSLTPT